MAMSHFKLWDSCGHVTGSRALEELVGNRGPNANLIEKAPLLCVRDGRDRPFHRRFLWNMVGEMETKEKPKPSPDYLMQLMNDKKLMSSLPNFCGIFNHLERLLDEGEQTLHQTETNRQSCAYESELRCRFHFHYRIIAELIPDPR
ncbi:hypothetical protein DNTS_017875 [Danionella cerebrum]|uniref:STAR protein homodimerisation region domain-containing protein n=1 Tax=Danionella cerebrum TaxID=2873325 RepID=A0A553N244_9TELE|nr:hypothetical protein DNTS_017875 [Danionella translucida]